MESEQREAGGEIAQEPGYALEPLRARRVSVKDCGVGIELQAIAQLFKAFYRTKQGGMGIRLSVSRSTCPVPSSAQGD
jgi:signal transduction histidine kinase